MLEIQSKIAFLPLRAMTAETVLPEDRQDLMFEIDGRGGKICDLVFLGLAGSGEASQHRCQDPERQDPENACVNACVKSVWL